MIGSGRSKKKSPRQASPVKQSMNAKEYVTALYELALQRAPDEAGLADNVQLLRASGDPTLILNNLMASPEFQVLQASAAGNDARSIDAACEPLISTALAAIREMPCIVDVGAQQLGAESDAYYPLTRLTPVKVFGFDPLAERLAARQASGGEAETVMHPFALGDGQTHTLFVNDPDATSSLFELNHELNRHLEGLRQLRTVETKMLETRRMDDLLDLDRVDFLKLDVQGGELLVLANGLETLARTLVVHTEVEFGPIYIDQPLYPQVQTLLNEHGFYLVDIENQARYRYATSSGVATTDRLLWGDAVFFKEVDDPDELAMQALIAASVYRKPGFAAHLLERAGEEAR